MNERMRQQTEAYQQSTGTTQQAKSNHDTPGEYIDFEEVKDWYCISLFLLSNKIFYPTG